MGETTTEMNGGTPDEKSHHENTYLAPGGKGKAQGVAGIRDEIEQTRADLSLTIDAIQEKLDPQRIKAHVTQSVREATLGKAQQVAHSVGQKLNIVREIVTESAAPALHSASVKASEMWAAHGPDSATGAGNGANGGALKALPAGKTSGAPLKPIAEQVVVVFGASSGIGRETALAFVQRGARVVVAARGEAGLQSLVESIHNIGGEAVYVVADVTDFAQVKAVADRAVAEYGRLDTWVHCAAVSLYATFEQTTPEEFKWIVDVNLVGQAYGAMAALPHLRREGRGALIHISSIEARRAFPLQSAYSSSKHGIIGFLDALRMELQAEGVPISVTNVMPAGINTPLFNKARTKLGVKPMPAPPIYQPSIVAEVILHAAQHPTRDIIAGGAGQMLALMQRLSPALVDAVLQRTGFEGQKTNEAKSEDAPDNLFGPIGDYDKVDGDFGTQAKSSSWGNWIETHPAARRALKGAALAGTVLIAARGLKRR